MNDVNFFSHYQGKKKEKISTNMYIYGAMAIAGLFIVITFGINTFRIHSLNKSIDEYNNKLQAKEIQIELKQAKKINNEMELLSEYYNGLADIAQDVKSRDNVSYELLDEISSTLPSEISFKRLEIIDNVVAIKGISTNRTGVAELKHNLSELTNMQDVYVDSIDHEEAVEGEYSFEIKCVLKDV